MADNRIQLTHEIDFSKSVSGARSLERTLGDAHKRMDVAVKTTATNVARAAPAMTSAMSAMTAGTLASQQAWTSLAGVVAGSFAAGGLIGGGIALAGAAIGALARSGKDEVSEFEKRIVSLRTDNGQLVEDIKRAEQELRAARGVDDQVERLKKLNVEVEHADRAYADFLNTIVRARKEGGLVLDPRDPSRQLFPSGQKKLKEQLREEREEITLQRDRLQKVLDLRDELADVRRGMAVGASAEALRRQVDLQRDLVGAGSDFERFQARLKAQIRELREVRGIGPDDISNFAEVATGGFFDRRIESLRAQSDAVERQARVLKVLEPFERERLAIAEDLARAMQKTVVSDGATDEVRAEADRLSAALRDLEATRLNNLEIRKRESLEVVKFTRSLGPQISNAFADATIAGFERGFSGAKDIGRSFLRSLLGQLLNLGTSAALNAVAPSLFPQNVRFFAHGGIIDRPTLAMMGERGPEEVRPVGSQSFVRELAQAIVEAGGGGGGANVNVLIDPKAAWDIGARGSSRTFVRHVASETLRPTTRAMAVSKRRRRF